MSSFQANLQKLCEQNAALGLAVQLTESKPWTPPKLKLEGGNHVVLGVADVEAPGEVAIVEPDVGKIRAYLESATKIPAIYSSPYELDYRKPISVTVADPKLEVLRGEILAQYTVIKRTIDEFASGSQLFYRNCSRNLKELPRAQLAPFGKYCNVPAVICGAGPSLVQPPEGALVLACGSAMGRVKAHYGVAIDPHNEHVVPDLPTFFRLRWKALERCNKPIYVPGSVGYPIVPWIEKQLGIEGPFLEEGNNSVCFAVEIARHLGCNPIVFAGLDLSAGGKTEPKWVAEANWLADYARRHPKITFFNATGGGLGIEGVPNVSPEFAPRDMQMHDTPVIGKRVDLGPVKESLERCCELLRQPRCALVEVELQEELAYDLCLAVPSRVTKRDDFPFLLETARTIGDSIANGDV